MSAISGRIETAAPAGKNSRFYLQWQLVSQNVANNTSTINWQAGLDISRWDLWYRNAVRIGGGHINGHNIPPGTWSNIFGSTQLRSGTITIQHNADGTKSFGADILGWLYSYGQRYRNGSWTLPTIPRATQPSMPGSITVGQNVTINLPRASGSFTHRVQYSFNGATGVISNDAGTSVVWSVPNALANTRPNNTSGTGVITVETFNGGTHIGTKTVGFTANIPNTSVFMPTITSYSHEEANEDVKNKFSFYIQHKSQLKLKMTAAGAFGSTVDMFQFMYEDWVSDLKSNEATTPLLPIGGTRVIGYTAVDSRVRTPDDLTMEVIEVEEYVDPLVTFAFSRADNTGAWDEDGDHVIIYPGALIAPLRDENDHEFKLKYKKRSETNWTEIPITPAGTGPHGPYYLDFQDDLMLIPNIDVDSPYDFVLEATDFFSTSQYPVVVPTAFTMMDFHSSGRAVSFGRVANHANRFEIGPKLPFNVIANTNDEEDFGLMRMRRADDSLIATLSTGPNGVGVKTDQYDPSGARNGDFVFLNAHPVGSTYWNESDSRNPGLVHGGTWVALPEVVLAGHSGASGSPFNVTPGNVVGANTHTLTNDQVPPHWHTIYLVTAHGDGIQTAREALSAPLQAGGRYRYRSGTGLMDSIADGNSGWNGKNEINGTPNRSTSAFNIIQRSRVGYLWLRTA